MGVIIAILAVLGALGILYGMLRVRRGKKAMPKFNIDVETHPGIRPGSMLIGSKKAISNGILLQQEQASDIAGSIRLPKATEFDDGGGLRITGGYKITGDVNRGLYGALPVGQEPDIDEMMLKAMEKMHPGVHDCLTRAPTAVMEDFKRFLAEQRAMHDAGKEMLSQELKKRQEDYERMCRESAAYGDRARVLSKKLEGEVTKQQLFLARIGSIIEGQVDLLPMDLEDNGKPLGPPTTFELDAGLVREVLNMYWDLVADQMEQKIGGQPEVMEMTNSEFESFRASQLETYKPEENRTIGGIRQGMLRQKHEDDWAAKFGKAIQS